MYNSFHDDRYVGYSEGRPGPGDGSGAEQPIPAESFRVEDAAPVRAKKSRFWPKAVALCLVCALLGGAAGAAGTWFATRGGGAGGGGTTLYESGRLPASVNVSSAHTGREMTLEEIYATWVNSCVGISTEIVTTNYFGQTVSAAAGSGFVISKDGYIVTNYHVIDGASSIKVTFFDGSEYDATLVGGEQTNDVAVLKIQADGLIPVILGTSGDLHVGQTVTTIGNPLGEMTFSQTAGIISALDRTVTMSGGTKMNMIQTDCTINSGNSGGPLFNSFGEVIGITSAKYSNNGSYSEATIEGIGFAIPMDDVIDMIRDIIEYGYVTGKPNAGILIDRNGISSDAQRYGIPAGVEVLAVLDGSGSAKAGLKAGDIITAVDGAQVEDASALQAALQAHRAGDQATFTVYRSGQTLDLEVTLDEANEERSAAMDRLQQAYEQEHASSNDDTGSNGSGNGFFFGWPFNG